jgi:hypothetical protein
MGSLTTNTTIISDGIVHIGALGLSNNISLDGSIEYQYHNIDTDIGTLMLTADHYFIEVMHIGTHTIDLLDASTAVGRRYIISKGFVGDILTITTTPSDNIDGVDIITLNILNQRIQLISNGLNK